MDLIADLSLFQALAHQLQIRAFDTTDTRWSVAMGAAVGCEYFRATGLRL